MDVLIVLETANGKIHRVSLEAVAATQKFAVDNTYTTAALLMGEDDGAVKEACALGVGEVLLASHSALKDYNNDAYAQALQQIIAQEKPRYLFMGHSYLTRDYIPKVSAALGIPFISDVVAYEKSDDVITFTKPVFNGRLKAQFTADPKTTCIVSFQAAAFSVDKLQPGSPATRTVALDIDNAVVKTQAEPAFRESAEGVDLSAAKVIVSIGRGMAKEGQMPLLRELAQALGAELGCSRPVVDAGLLPASHQIGSSGQSVSPDLYLALGISGAAQHVVGMKASKATIAINKDPEAPIFDVAQYGVVADAMEILPPLIEAVKKAKQSA